MLQDAANVATAATRPDARTSAAIFIVDLGVNLVVQGKSSASVNAEARKSKHLAASREA